MPRLDVWLVEKGHFSSRQAAKRAIKKGLVLVNGREGKPSNQVSEKDTIELLSTGIDVPQGYQKLKEIDEILEGTLVCGACSALDIGSSAGGFLIYLAEKDATIIGIEVSERFAQELHSIVEKYPQVSVIFADAFDLDPTIITGNGKLDLLLIDVTTDPSGTMKLIEKFTPLLKKGGRILAALKIDTISKSVSTFKDVISQLGYEQVQDIALDRTRQEVHFTALRL